MSKDNMQKRVPKAEVKFQVQLSEEQKVAKDIILGNKITVLSGKAGSSKSFLACQVALSEFFKRKYSRITIMRPTVASEDIGFMPGNLEEKMSPWFLPVIENMYIIYNKAAIDKMLEENNIRMLPLQFTQGTTFVDEIVILDEAQNCTKEQLKMVMTRLGKTSSLVITGDPGQIQMKRKSDSGLQELIDLQHRGVSNLGVIELKSNYRDPIVAEIIAMYDNGI